MSDEPTVRFGAARDRAIVALLTALCAGLGLWRLSASSIWLDEAYTIAVATSPTEHFASDLLYNGANMSLYLVFMRLWLEIDSSELWLRLPSVAFGAGTIPVFFCLVRRTTGQRTARMATVLLATAAPVIWYSQEARAYTLLLLLVTASWLALLRGVDPPWHRRWYVLFAALSVFAHVIAVFFVAAQLAWLALTVSRRTAMETGALVAAASAPQWVAALRPEAARPDWVPPLSVDGLTDALSFVVGARWGAPALVMIGVLAAGGYLAACAVARGNRALLAPLLWVALPLFGIVAVSIGRPFLVPRYLVPLVPAVAWLLAIACSRLRRTGWLGVAMLLLVGWPALEDAVHRRNPDWRNSTALILENTEPGDGIVFVSGSRHMAEYYWVRNGRPDAPTPVFEPYEWHPPRRRYPAIDLDTAAQQARDLRRIWVLTQSSSGIRPPTDSDQEAVRRLVAPRVLSEEWQFGPSVSVLLYE